jgi:TPP-dependent pyruvate/acetoin dehydrogenase alpha subunit
VQPLPAQGFALPELVVGDRHADSARVGAAFAAKRRGIDEVHTIYFGDGATSSNGFHSGMNFAAVWKAPCVFVCVDNGWAISVCSAKQTAAESFADKALAYGMPGETVDGNDVLACHAAVKKAIERAQSGQGPSLVVLETYRMMGHSSSDDPTKYRDEKEVAKWAAKDPIDRFEKLLVERGVIAKDARAKLETELYTTIDAEIHKQEAAPKMALRTLVEDVYADVPRTCVANTIASSRSPSVSATRHRATARSPCEEPAVRPVGAALRRRGELRAADERPRAEEDAARRRARSARRLRPRLRRDDARHEYGARLR